MKYWNFYISIFVKPLFVWSGVFLMCFSVLVPLVARAQDTDDVEETKDDIKSIEKKISKEKNVLNGLSKNLQVIDGNLTATQRAIQLTQTHLETTQETISRKEGEILQLEKRLEQEKTALQEMMQFMYDTSKIPVSEVVFHEGSVSRLLDGSDYILTVGDQMNVLIEESLQIKNKIEDEQEELTGIKKEKERLLLLQSEQKKDLLADKKETQSDISEKMATIGELQKKLAELQSDLSILTGKSYDAKDIREAVEFASEETGVPKGVLYGFLKMETNLGANTGQCTYKEVEKVSVARYKKYGSKYKKSIDLLYKRRDIFYEIVDTLDYSKDKKVSCSPNYIGQGGAMGVSQFMSDTWRGYEAQVRSKTGHKNPDPWNLTDGVMALALKIRNAGATSDSTSAIKKASINYLGAFNKGYYEGIVYWSKNYKTLFN